MYVKDGATILADSSRVLGGILSRPVVFLLLGLSKAVFTLNVNYI